MNEIPFGEPLPTILVPGEGPPKGEPHPALRSSTFRAEREASFRELEALLKKMERGGIRALAAPELSRLPLLYRAALSSLSVARAISLDKNLLDYLESLCARAYLAVYAARRPLKEALSDFFVRRFPRLVRAHFAHVTLGFALLLLGLFSGASLTRADPDRFYAFVNPVIAQGRGPTSSTESLREVLYTKGEAARMLKTFAMFLFSNNARVGLTAFAVGFAGGIPSALLLFGTGLMMGAFAELYSSRGLALEFWAWSLPHGVTELTAVVLCGAAGMALGQALLFPGREERGAGLSRRGREAAVVALGAVALFFVAALLEGIFRQLVYSIAIRLGVALASAVFLALYLCFSGRERSAPR
ncbi:MAG TPA: stage II sporulation protein M [Anaeromyxobacter sp.]|nr:stage II sporulation protein M [Anaeromyxobacter sp.]